MRQGGILAPCIHTFRPSMAATRSNVSPTGTSSLVRKHQSRPWRYFSIPTEKMKAQGAAQMKMSAHRMAKAIPTLHGRISRKKCQQR
mmetsp:Transcript_9909/g.23900  ORF Transcript_9909/g.23900 Transcript_9909/m.23900 type:complete len:87 (-) Transcript_9909:86-346(-)